jgi:hypothetical protein
MAMRHPFQRSDIVKGLSWEKEFSLRDSDAVFSTALLLGQEHVEAVSPLLFTVFKLLDGFNKRLVGIGADGVYCGHGFDFC